MDTVTENIGMLLGRLQSPDYFEREKAVKELSNHCEDEAVAGLVLALEDPDMGIRELAAEHVVRIGGQIACQLLIQFLANPDIGSRNLASEMLVRIGDDAIEALLAEVESDDHDVRKFVVDILGLLKAKPAVEALTQRLWDENTNVVCSAAEALGEIGSPEAIPHLLAVFEKVEDVQLQVVEAIGKIGDSSALEKLYSFLKIEDHIIAYTVIEAVGRIGDPESIKEISPFLNHEERLIAEAAMTAIVRISTKVGGKLDFDLPLDKFSEFLFDGIKNRDEEITNFTLSRLGHWYGNDVIAGLIGVLDFVDEERLKQITEVIAEIGPAAGKFIVEKLPEASSSMKVKLLDILKEFVDSEMGAELSRLYEDPDPEVRQRIAYVLGASGNTDCIRTLKKLAQDPNGHVRAAAFSALGWLCNQAEVEFVFRGLDDRYPDVREAAVGALIISGGAQVVAKFTEDLYHEDTERQRLAVTALGWIGEVETVEPLLKAINHPDASVRRSAINSLARIGEVTDPAAIVMALNDENSSVRKAAVTALITLLGEAAIKDVRFLLDDQDVWVQYHTINAIGEMKISKYAELMCNHLDHEQDIIKIAAMKAMSLMGARDTIPKLKELTTEKNEDVSKAASCALSSFGETQ